MNDEKKKNLLLRIPQDLWADLNVWARDELRSVNAQIEYVLREAVRRRCGGRRSPADALDQASATTAGAAMRARGAIAENGGSQGATTPPADEPGDDGRPAGDEGEST